MTMLKDKNSHERDSKIKFYEDTHTYFVNDTKIKISVTTFVKSFFKEFNSDQVIKNMMRSKNWCNSKYYGQTTEEIKNGWEHNRVEAARLGTQMHKYIEDFYNNNNSDELKDVKEIEMFHTFQEENCHLKPYRTEWEIYDEDLDIAGSIDMLYENEDGTLSIYDWKRCAEIKKENKWGKGKYPFQHLPDTNYWHYCLQLNTYKAILEEKYGKIVDELYLVCLHPENKNKNYQRIKVVNLQDEVKGLFDLRRKELFT